MAGKSKKYETPSAFRVSRSTRAGLYFPVGRIHRQLKQRLFKRRISPTAAIYLAGVLEYVTAEVLELASEAAVQLKVKRVTPRHLKLAIRSDEELEAFIKATIPGAGGTPAPYTA